MITVLDTSALLRLFIPDGPVPHGLEPLIREAERGNEAILAPELLLAEAGQVLLKKRAHNLLSAQEAVDILRDILALPVKYEGHRVFLPRAMDLAVAHKLTVYDAIFLSLAEGKGASLITADASLAKAARAMGL